MHAHCVGFRKEQGHVSSQFADGHEQQTDLLVGANGLYSVIREQLLGKVPPAIAATPVGGGALFEDQGRIDDEVLRQVERELDLEEQQIQADL